MSSDRRDPRGRVSGKCSLVTGASSGIGEGIALALAREGAVVTVWGRDEQRVSAVSDEIRSMGGEAYPALGDVADPEDVTRVVDEAAGRMGQLDIVVNCAGIGEQDGWVPVHEHSQAGWERTIAVNLTGPFLVAKAAIPQMTERGAGTFLHISSVCAQTVWAGDSAYGVSKAGLNALSNHIAVEYGSQGLRSNTLMPGEILTPMHASAAAASPDAAHWEQEVLSKHPIGRFGEVSEVAEAAVFLCSDESGFLTGANVPIDGAYAAV